MSSSGKKAPPPPPKKAGADTETEVDSDAPVKRAAPPPPKKPAADSDVDSDKPSPAAAAKKAPPPPPKKAGADTETEVDSDAPVKRAAPPPPKKPASDSPSKPKMREDETDGNDDSSADEKTPVVLKKTAPPPPKKTEKASSDVEPAMESDEASAARRAPPIPPVTKLHIEDDSSGDETEAERASKKKPAPPPAKKADEGGDAPNPTSPLAGQSDAISPAKKLPPPPHPSKRSDSISSPIIKSPEKGGADDLNTPDTVKTGGGAEPIVKENTTTESNATTIPASPVVVSVPSAPTDESSSTASLSPTSSPVVKRAPPPKKTLDSTNLALSTLPSTGGDSVAHTSPAKDHDEKKDVNHAEVKKDLPQVHVPTSVPTPAEATAHGSPALITPTIHDSHDIKVIAPVSVHPLTSIQPLNAHPVIIAEVPKPPLLHAANPSSPTSSHSTTLVSEIPKPISISALSSLSSNTSSIIAPVSTTAAAATNLEEIHPSRPTVELPKHPRKEVEFSIESSGQQSSSSNATSVVVALSVSPPQRANTVVSSLRDEALSSYRSVVPQDGATGNTEIAGSPRQGGAYRGDLSPSRDASAMLLTPGSVEQRKLAIIAQQKELERQLALHQEQLHALEAERVKLAEAEVAESLKNSSSALMAHVSDSSVDFSQQKSLIDTLKKQQMQIAALSDLAASAEQRALLLDDLVRNLQTKLQEYESRAASTVQALVNVVGKKELLSRLYDFKAKMNVSHEAGHAISHLAALLSSPDISGSGSRASYKPTSGSHQSRERAQSRGKRSAVSGGVRAPFQYLPAPAPSQNQRAPLQVVTKYSFGAPSSSSRNDLELDADPISSTQQQGQGRIVSAPLIPSNAGGPRKENPYDWAAYTARAQVMHNLPNRLNSPPSSTSSSHRTPSAAGNPASTGSSILSAALSSSNGPLQLRSPRMSGGSGMSTLSTPTPQPRNSFGSGAGTSAGNAPRLSPAAAAAAQPLARLQRMAGENPDAFANALKRIAGKAEELTTTIPAPSLQQQSVSRPLVLPVALKEKVKGDLASLDSQLAKEEGFLI
jgi:hypothetical protein